MVKQTAVLHKIRYALMRKQEYYKRGVYKVQPVPSRMKESLEERHITPDDPAKSVTTQEKPWKPEEVPAEIPPDFRNTWYQKPVREESKELNYWLTNSTSFSGGIHQACLLTKTQRLSGVPHRISQLMQVVEEDPFYKLEEEKIRLYQIGIMQSQIWDPTMKRLPKRRDTEKLNWVFRREIGIPHNRSATVLLNHLLYAASHLSESYPELVRKRRIIYKPEVELNYDFLGNNIIIRTIGESLTYGHDPLPPFLGEQFIESSKEHTILPMDPLLPTIDLEETTRTISKSRGAVEDVRGLTCRHPQTLFRTTGTLCRQEKLQAYNLMLAFATAATEARQRYGITEGVLPKPVVIQNVTVTYNKIHFIFYQLNTLDTQTKDGVKNFAWHDSQQMFRKKLPKPWREKHRRYKPTEYLDLQMEPFKRFLAVYLNGVKKV